VKSNSEAEFHLMRNLNAITYARTKLAAKAKTSSTTYF